jgi:hypothetical protein
VGGIIVHLSKIDAPRGKVAVSASEKSEMGVGLFLDARLRLIFMEKRRFEGGLRL